MIYLVLAFASMHRHLYLRDVLLMNCVYACVMRRMMKLVLKWCLRTETDVNQTEIENWVDID